MQSSRQPAFALLVLLLFVLAASPALAGEVIEGDGYSLGVPPGFRALPSRDCSG